MNNKKNTIIALLLVVALALTLTACNKRGIEEYNEFDTTSGGGIPSVSDPTESSMPAFTEAEIQQLRDELAEQYQIYIDSQPNDDAAWERKIKKLMDELDALKAELVLKTPPKLDVIALEGKYEARGELVTLIYSYEIMYQVKTEGNILVNKNIVYSIPGTLKLGVSFDKVKNGLIVDDAKKTVTVTVPKAYFVSNAIDEGGVERYDVTRGIFSKVEDKDYLNVAQAAKAEVELRETNNGMLTFAQHLAGLELIGLIEPITSVSGYQIVVVYE